MNIKKLEKILRMLSSTIQSVRIYTVEHPKAQKAIEDVYSSIMDYCSEFGTCEFGLANDEVFSGKEIFFDLSSQLKDLTRVLQTSKIQRIAFTKSLMQKEMTDFFTLLVLVSEESDMKTLAKEKGIDFIGITFGHLGVASNPASESSDSNKTRSLVDAYSNMLSGNKNVVDSLINNVSVDTAEAYNFSCDLLNMVSFNRESLFTMMNLKRHDDYTFVHSLNVAVLSIFQAQYLGLDRKVIIRLGMAGMLHDSGKKKIKNDLLNKKEKLNDAEFKTVQSHTLAGAEVLMQSEDFDPLSVIAAYQHHIGVRLERYPKAVYLKKQSVAAKIIAISDVYDALRSRRSYKESMPLEQVFEIMQREKGRILDTELVDLFFKHVGLWPEGTLVKLNTEEIAIVKENNIEDMHNPIIEIAFDAKGDRLSSPQRVDMSNQKDLHINRKIIKHITPDTDQGKKYVAAILGE